MPDRWSKFEGIADVETSARFECSSCGVYGLVSQSDGRPFAGEEGRCLGCGRRVRLVQPRRGIETDLYVALREADLSVDQLTRLAAALAAATPETTAAEISAVVPKSRKVVRLASALTPGEWIALLTLVLAALTFFVGPKQPNVGSDERRQTQRTSQLSDEDLRKLRQQVLVDLAAREDAAEAERDEKGGDQPAGGSDGGRGEEVDRDAGHEGRGDERVDP